MVSVLTLPTAPIRTAPAARARFVFRAGRAGALGWTISKIVFEAQRVLLHWLDKLSRGLVPWLDKLSRGLVPKWHNPGGFLAWATAQGSPAEHRRARDPGFP